MKEEKRQMRPDQKRPEYPEQITLVDISIDAMTEAFATVDIFDG